MTNAGNSMLRTVRDAVSLLLKNSFKHSHELHTIILSCFEPNLQAKYSHLKPPVYILELDAKRWIEDIVFHRAINDHPSQPFRQTSAAKRDSASIRLHFKDNDSSAKKLSLRNQLPFLLLYFLPTRFISFLTIFSAANI